MVDDAVAFARFPVRSQDAGHMGAVIVYWGLVRIRLMVNTKKRAEDIPVDSPAGTQMVGEVLRLQASVTKPLRQFLRWTGRLNPIGVEELPDASEIVGGNHPAVIFRPAVHHLERLWEWLAVRTAVAECGMGCVDTAVEDCPLQVGASQRKHRTRGVGLDRRNGPPDRGRSLPVPAD